MKISLSWLKELVDYKLTPKELAEKLSLVSIGVKQITDDFLELDLTYNRGDLLSLRGVAREVAAILNSKLFFKDETTEYNLPRTPVKVENSDLCPVYCVAKIKNLRVEQSDDTWVKKLSDSGQRSINNIADVTNLIMLEYGQPMHAFDAAQVREDTLVVRQARTAEKLTTLDGKVRNLNKEDLLITDTQKPLGLAGVMGGKNSEVSSSTTDILLEAAIFDPVNNRKTAKRHGLFSEASKRFQHGLTKTNLLQALNAAIKMYEDLGGKLTAISLVGDLEEKLKTITLTQEKISSLLGAEIPQDKVETSLKALGFGISKEVTIPYWRLDIQIEEDLIEEVARMYGYDKIEGTKLPDEKIPSLDQSLPQFIYNLKLKLKEAGLTEVETYSFFSTAVLEALGVPKQTLMRIANPISTETEYLRTDLWPNLVEVVGKNIRKGYRDIGIFEIGKVYWQKDGQPKENYRLSITLMNGSDNPINELTELFKKLGFNVELTDIGKRPMESEYEKLFHPKRFISFKKGQEFIGGVAEVHLRILNKLGIEKRVAVLEADLIDL